MKNNYLPMIEEALSSYLPSKDCLQKDVVAAMEYSLMAGGKRIRPTLTLEFCRICGGDVQAALPFACAVEMIHSYSLIHDDLPCMDDSNLRRGRPSNHIQFGEDIALLAGDGLLTLAFETALAPENMELAGPQKGAEAAYLLAKAAGAEGMVGGQVIDLQHENQHAPIETLIEMDRKKTGALIQAAVQMGCAVAGASQAQREAAKQYASCIGLAFQIRDDILDVISDSKTLGKPVGSDASNHKETYTTLIGVEASQKEVDKLFKEAIKLVYSLSINHGLIIEIIELLWKIVS